MYGFCQHALNSASGDAGLAGRAGTKTASWFGGQC